MIVRNNESTDTRMFKVNDFDNFQLTREEIENVMFMPNKENANVPHGPEATNMTFGEMVKSDYACRHIFSPDVVAAHRDGSIHIHDIGMVDRIYCSGQSLEYVKKYGLSLPNSISIAKPAKHPEVLIAQMIKLSAALQGHFAGAIGWDAVNVFLSPYLVGKSDKELKQLAQILVYEFAQQAVARGGQSLTSATPIIIRRIDNGALTIVPIGTFCHRYLDANGSMKFDNKEYETPSLNLTTGEIEWKPINAVFVHKPASPLKRVNLASGRSVVVTSDHSLFTLNGEGDFIEATATDECDTYLVANRIKTPTTEGVYGLDEAWAFGVMIGDGCVVDGHSARLCSGSEAVAQRFGQFLKNWFGWRGKVISRNGSFVVSCARGAGGYFSPIGHLSQNKVIPDVFLTAPDNVVLELLAGIIDSDGGISRNRYEISTTSTMLRHQLEFLFNRLGLKYGVRTRDTKSNFNRNYPVHVLLLSAESSKLIDVYRETRQIPVGLTMCNEKHSFSAIKSKVKAEFGVGISNIDYTFRSCGRRLKHHQLMKVVDKLPWVKKYENVLPMICNSVEDYEDCEEFVYDIGVDDNENFILPNGIICHNSIFSDLNLYWETPDHFENTPAIGPGGIYTGHTYHHYEADSQRFANALVDVYMEGDGAGRPFFFPKPEFHITEKFFKTDGHEDFLYRLSKLASVRGTPYFVFDRGDTAKVSQCCRLSFKLKSDDIEDAMRPETMRFSALQNVSLNLPRVAFLANGNQQRFEEILRSYMVLAVKAHIQKKNFINKLLDMGRSSPLALLNMDNDGTPYFRREKASFLIGMVGMNEAVKIMTGQEMHEGKDAVRFGLKTTAQMHKWAAELSAEYNINLPLEQSPAESTAYRFARLDKAKFDSMQLPYKMPYNGDVETGDIYYTNSTYLNVGANVDPITRVKTEGMFHPLIEAGALSHVWLGESMPDASSISNFVTKTFSNTQNAQIAFSPEFTSCNKCHQTTRGLSDICLKCGSTNVDNITRVTGFFSKVGGWNPGKRAELKDRFRASL